MIRLAHIIIIVFTLFALSRLILRLKDKEIRLLEFITWFLVWLGVLAIVFMPTLISGIEQVLGIKKGIDFFASAGIVLLFYLLFRIMYRPKRWSRISPRLSERLRLMKRIRRWKRCLQEKNRRNGSSESMG